MLTPFFGTCQGIGERKECQVENDDGVQEKGIGHGLVPIRRLSAFWANFDMRRSRFGMRCFLFIEVGFLR